MSCKNENPGSILEHFPLYSASIEIINRPVTKTACIWNRMTKMYRNRTRENASLILYYYIYFILYCFMYLVIALIRPSGKKKTCYVHKAKNSISFLNNGALKCDWFYSNQDTLMYCSVFSTWYCVSYLFI